MKSSDLRTCLVRRLSKLKMSVQFDFIEVDYRGKDYRLAYFIRPAGKPALLYLHGLGGSKSDFVSAARVPALEDFTLVGIDIPGCGQSSYCEDAPLEMQDIAEIITGALDVLNLKQVIVIASSFSGVTSILLIRSHPERVQGFVNIEGNLAPEDCDVFSREVSELPFEGREEEYFSHLRRRMIRSGPGFRTFAEIFRANVGSARAWYDYCKSIVDYSDMGRLLDEFIHMSIPRMLIYGEENRHLSYLQRLREAGVPVVEVPGSNHFTCYSNPDFQCEVIAEFVRNIGT